MKKFRKLSALLMAAFMVMTMMISAMAAGTTIGGTGTPSASDTGKVTISNVYEADAVVTAYQITKGVYDNGFKGYEATAAGVNTDAPSLEASDYASINYADVMAIANDQTLLGTLPQVVLAPKTGEDGTYEGQLGAGYWIVKIVGNDPQKIYNPMLIGVYYHTGSNEQVAKTATIEVNGAEKEGVVYKVDGVEYVKIDDPAGFYKLADATPVSDTSVLAALNDTDPEMVNKSATGEYLYMDPTPLDATTKWSISGAAAVAKESQIDVKKEIEDNSKHDPASDSNKHGDDHAFGDIVTFKGTTNVPAYSADYTDLTYVIKDTMDAHALQLVGVAATPGNDPVKETTLAEGESLGDNDVNGTYIKITVGNVTKDIKKGDAKVVFVEADAANNVAEQSAEVSITDNTFIITFNEAAIRNNPDAPVTLEYQARILKGATTNFNENENDLSVTFTNNPEEDENGKNKTKEINDKTYHYTFEIDGNLDGEEETGGSHTNKHGHELVKTGTQDIENDGMIVFTNKNGDQVYAKLHTDNRYYLTNEEGEWIDDTGAVKADPTEPAVEWEIGETSEWTKKTAPMGLEGAKFKLTYVAPEAVYDKKYVINGEGTQYDTRDAAAAVAKDGDVITEIKVGREMTLAESQAVKVTGGKEYYCTTDQGGRMNFKGLDTGYYELEEVSPPDGYSLNSNKVTVRITAEYYAADEGEFKAGELKSYKIERAAKAFDNVTEEDFENGQTSVYSETRQSNASGSYDSTITETYEGADTTFFENTKMPELPSTGGMGTYLFTIAGVAILALASFLLIFKRRREAV